MTLSLASWVGLPVSLSSQIFLTGLLWVSHCLFLGSNGDGTLAIFNSVGLAVLSDLSPWGTFLFLRGPIPYYSTLDAAQPLVLPALNLFSKPSTFLPRPLRIPSQQRAVTLLRE